jgi:hypothetical protein
MSNVIIDLCFYISIAVAGGVLINAIIEELEEYLENNKN